MEMQHQIISVSKKLKDKKWRGKIVFKISDLYIEIKRKNTQENDENLIYWKISTIAKEER